MNKTIMIALVAVISIASCKKEIDWAADKSNKCQLTTLVTDLGVFGKYTISYAYDASGKLVKATSDGESKVYTYSATKITGLLDDGEKMELTLSNGRATASYYSDFFQVNGVGVAVTRTYTYNADGYLSVIKSYLLNKLNSTAELTYSNGNLTQTKVTYAVDGEVEIIKYEYSNQLVINPYEMADPLSLVVDYIPGSYFGKSSKNVVIKSTERSTRSGVEFVSDYSYKFDAKGNTTSIVIKSGQKLDDGSIIDESSTSADLVYNCK